MSDQYKEPDVSDLVNDYLKNNQPNSFQVPESVLELPDQRPHFVISRSNPNRSSSTMDMCVKLAEYISTLFSDSTDRLDFEEIVLKIVKSKDNPAAVELVIDIYS